LWYRSCLKLTHLDGIVSRKASEENCLYSQVSVIFEDFFAVICEILREDETVYLDLMEHTEHDFAAQSAGRNWKEFLVGDIVELVEGYEMFGDAARGPMVPGDRGQVVEVQQGSNGERYSIRVLFNGRRWWYQPQTLLSEKSSQVATPGIWFIQRILRSHGYNYVSLQPMWGNPVTNASWLVGDIVVPATIDERDFSSVKDSLVGRVVPPSTVSASQGQINDRDSGMVCVEFVEPRFGLRVGLVEETSDVRSPSRAHRVSVKQLTHAGISQVFDLSENLMDISEDASDDYRSLTSTMLTKDIMSISTLDVAAIESVSKACEKNFGTLARLFTLGLPSALTSALELAKMRAKNNEEVSSFLPALTAIGNLIVLMAKQCFGIEAIEEDGNAEEGQETKEAAKNNIMAPSHASFSNHGDSIFTHDQSLSQEMSESSLFEQSHKREHCPSEVSSLRDQSPLLNSLRRGGFEAPLLGEDARRGSLVLNAATKSAILNGLLASNYAWFHRVAETAKRRKSSSANSSLINARDEDGTQLLTLAISLGCSKSTISFLVRNGAAINDDVIKKAAYLGQKSVLAYLLNEYVYVEGALNHAACSEEIIKTIKNARDRQKEQENNLHEKSQEFLRSIVKSFIEFGIEMRCCFAPKANIYRVIAQFFVGRTLLRAIHNTRLSANLSGISSIAPTNPKVGSIDPESGRVAVFLDDEKVDGDQHFNPSSVAAFEGLLFAIPPSRFLNIVLDTDEATKRSLPAYLCFMEALIWTKDVEDIALGLALLAIFMRRVPVQSQIATLKRFGIADMLSFHTCEADKQLEKLAKNRVSLLSDSRRFSPQHVASREQEIQNLLSIGIVLCPKCHVADLHLTRHSSFRCDLCGKGIDRGYPMHGCRECDWDACEDCINKSEGGVVKWAHVKRLVHECLLLHSPAQTSADQLEQMPRSDWSSQTLPTRIKAFDCGALEELSAQLELPGAITMFEFTSYYLPLLHDTLYEASSRAVPPDPNIELCDPPKKKQRPQYVPFSNMIDRTTFFTKAVDVLLLKPIEMSIMIEEENKATTKKRSSNAVDEPETVALPGDDVKLHKKQSNEHLACHAPEILRRLHEILSFCERFPVLSSCTSVNHNTDDLRSLTKPWEIEVVPVDSSIEVGVKPFVLHVEPLIQISDVTRHIAQFAACNVPSYFAFCQSLADDHSIIAECIRTVDNNKVYRLGQIIRYDSETGAHTLKYASSINYPFKHNERLFLNPELVNTLQFEGPEATLLLNCRQYVVIKRFKNTRQDEYKSIVQNVLQARDIAEEKSGRLYPNEALARGIRVGYSCSGGSNFKAHTIIGCSNVNSDAELDTGFLYDLVSEEGIVLKGISQQDIKHEQTEKYGLFPSARILREGMGLHSREPANPLIGLRGISSGENELEKFLKPKVGTLRRTWSALSPRDDLVPVDLRIEGQRDHDDIVLRSMLKCTIPGHDIESFLPFEFVEEPPQISVKFSLNESSPPLDTSPGTATFHALIQRLSMRKSSSAVQTNIECANRIRLFYTITANQNVRPSSKVPSFAADHFMNCVDEETTSMLLVKQSRPLLPEMTDLNKDSRMSRTWVNNCEKIAIRSMQLIDCLGQHIHESGAVIETRKQSDALTHDIVDAALESRSLTRKLSEQLDQTLSVASGALPTWCTEVPALAPRLFNYAVRRQLLERTAFGVSRATMRLQEAKVNVAPLRQRMAALRGRAVELVGEAFSGGAEDPTALQLQADELYGMEEALGARVNAAFRAQRWQERSLQCAKAAVRRSHLLADALAVMDKYTSNKMHRQRRLEVRFDGESGFDAASGDEAGVTRGFYADVAEAFLSCENIVSTGSGIICPSQSETQLLPKVSSVPLAPTMPAVHKKLSLWILDLDASFKVVIPTPRASPRSTPGVYPRPLSPDNEQMPSIKRQFRLIGRMFAGAIRDGFMFPLPLSSAFLQLVQHCDDISSGCSRPVLLQAGRKLSGMPRSPRLEQIDASDEYSCEENTPTTGVHPPVRVKAAIHEFKECLDSYDLPRPGFLGGEIFAVEKHICNALKDIDSMNLREDEAEKRYMQVASDRTFARKAFGKTYDCSFEEYFENKTFVDPLDPTQGAFAIPLCSNGHLREVTIFNVREYVLLCKQFILCDGVLEQAKAFQEGISDFFPAHYLRLFTSPELQRDVFGNDVEKWTEEDVRKLLKLDGARGATEALVAVAAIGGEGGASLSRRFGSSSPTIGFLIRTLLESTATQRRQFLNFVTSVPIVTPGKIEVVPIVSPSGDFLPVQDNCLPRANTCARRLYLPKFETYERFSSVLRAVVREESRFKGFFEWRGN